MTVTVCTNTGENEGGATLAGSIAIKTGSDIAPPFLGIKSVLTKALAFEVYKLIFSIFIESGFMNTGRT